jgi:hypothetical protein
VIGVDRGPEPVAEVPPSARVPTSEIVAGLRGIAASVSQVFQHSPLESELDNLVDDGKRGLDAVLATGGLGRSR